MDNNNETAHILVVDDEGAIRYSVSKTLQRVGYEVDEAATGEEALDMMTKREYDVVLTDIRMPGLTGVELLKRIKDISPDAIVILMTGYASLGTAVESLRLGAHDYLIKPSSSQDIRQSVSRGVERSRNLKRRRALLDAIRSNVFELTHAPEDSTASVYHDNSEMLATSAYDSPIAEPMTSNMTLGPLTIYPGRYQISVGDQPIDLTPTEFDLLLYLAAHRGRVVSCHELVREVRGYTVDEAEAREVIRPHVSNLRRKLKQTGQDADLIVNVRGIGYRLSEQSQ
ncbi:MAG: DNA-binding response regulator [Chloroflexi bacterium]|nr:DNA-binding response regulator [Chloroflexota bacterium]MDL1885243.1 response regulator transcription factor [Anaerolineae bacterium CFX8]GIL12858.1 MAG: DNA-binding response regulator [Chloroflexota bacterium]